MIRKIWMIRALEILLGMDHIVIVDMARDGLDQLATKIGEFNSKTRKRNTNMKRDKDRSQIVQWHVWTMVHNVFATPIWSLKRVIPTRTLWKNINIRISSLNFIRSSWVPNKKTKLRKRNQSLITKQMFQGLSMVLSKARAGNTSENLLSKIRQILSIHCIKQKKSQNKYTNNLIKSVWRWVQYLWIQKTSQTLIHIGYVVPY